MAYFYAYVYVYYCKKVMVRCQMPAASTRAWCSRVRFSSFELLLPRFLIIAVFVDFVDCHAGKKSDDCRCCQAYIKRNVAVATAN